jgi:uncharacterized protein (DUF58 family)
MPFRDAWLLIGGLLVFVGFGASQPVISGVGFVIIIVGGIARFWSRHAFTRVALRRRLGEHRMFIGEPVSLDVELENRKALPLPWFQWRLALSEPLSIDDEELASHAVPGSSWLVRRGALGWYEKRNWRFTFRVGERGYHQVGPASLRTADLFGLYPAATDDEATDSIVVYPRVVPLDQLGLPAERPFGDRRGVNRLFEDPLRSAGLREYRPGDPLRRIDWKATARGGELVSRVYEPPGTEQLYIALNIDTLQHAWEGYLKEELEFTICVAASIATWASGVRISTGIVANGSFPGADRPIRLPPARARGQLARVLEALAVIQPLTSGDLAATLEREASRIPAGSTVVAVASLVPEPLAAVLLRLQGEGHQVFVVGTSNRVAPTLPDRLPLHVVSRTDSARSQFARPAGA